MTTIVCPMLGSMMEAGLPVLAAPIYVRESERIGTTSPENLKPPYGLTDAEARVAASLAEGLAPGHRRRRQRRDPSHPSEAGHGQGRCQPPERAHRHPAQQRRRSAATTGAEPLRH